MARSMNALELLRNDHRHVLSLLRQFDETDDERAMRDLCGEIVAELDAHTELEEQVFYPYVREATDRVDLVEEATIEHGTAKDLLDEMRKPNSDPLHFHALGKVLGEYVALHVREEEQRIFPVVEKLGIDLEALGEELAERKRHPRRDADRARKARAGSERRAHGERTPAGRAAGEAGGETTAQDEEFLREHGEELSRSAQRAKWIHSPDEQADRPGQTLATRNPDVIRRWAEERNAQPATTPGGDAERPRVLRFDFPGYGSGLQPVSWDAWLGVFEQRNLVFLFQQRKSDGRQSNFFRLDNPGREEG